MVRFKMVFDAMYEVHMRMFVLICCDMLNIGLEKKLSCKKVQNCLTLSTFDILNKKKIILALLKKLV